MADHWSVKLDTYLDGELSANEMRDLDAHLRTCPPCAADILSRVQTRRAVHSVGKRYTPSPEFRARVQKRVTTKSRPSPLRLWFGASAAVALLLVVLLVAISARQQPLLARRQTFSELADLHVATLASVNPVDVISSDRHTVKPWFQGKIPFTFNLPELANSEFTLLGGRIAYLGQAPGAELIYQIRKHRISVFIFPDRTLGRELDSSSPSQKAASFNMQTWSQDGLRYFVIGDASGNDIRTLADMLKKAP